MDVLQKSKRLVLRGNVLFTLKAEEEMMIDGLDEDLVVEAIINAPAIAKRCVRRIQAQAAESICT